MTIARRPNPVRTQLRSLALPLLFGALLLGAQAHASEKTAVVLDPKVIGMLEPVDLTAIDKAVQTAFHDQQYQVVAKPERDGIITAAGNLKNCYRNDCLVQLGRLLGSQLVMAYKIKIDFVPLPGQPSPAAVDPKHVKHGTDQAAPAPAGSFPFNWEISAVLYDIEIGSVGARVAITCTNCSGPQAADKAAEMVKSAILEDASKQREMLEISSVPSNASVIVDGVELGVTPYKKEIFIGKHDITVRHTGYKSTNQEVTIVESRKSSVEIHLEQGQDSIKYIREYQPRPRWRLAVGGTLIGVGLVGVAYGAYALSVDGSCSSPIIAPSTQCKYIYSGKTLGAGLIGGGAAVIAAGAIVLLIPGHRNPLIPDTGIDTFGDKEKAADQAAGKPQAQTGVSIGGVGSGLGGAIVGTF